MEINVKVVVFILLSLKSELQKIQVLFIKQCVIDIILCVNK